MKKIFFGLFIFTTIAFTACGSNNNTNNANKVNNQNPVTKENLISIHPKMFELEKLYKDFDISKKTFLNRHRIFFR